MAPRANWLKRRVNVWWFQIAVPVAVQPAVGKKMVAENLKTADRRLAQHLALERAAHWKRQFDLLRASEVETQPPHVVFEEVVQRINWLKQKFRDPDDLDEQLDLLWDGYADPEARRLGVGELSEADPDDVHPEVAAALEAIKAARAGRVEAPAEFRAPFSDLAARYIADIQRDAANRLTLQTISQMEAVFRLFRDHIDDKPLATVKGRVVAAFFDKVKRLSPNWGRAPNTKVRTLDQLLAAYGKAGVKGLSSRTLNRYVSSLNGLWEWADSRGEVSGKNPFAGHWAKVKTRKNANAPWSDDALKVVLGLQPDPGTEGKPNPFYWLPRIALLSGMRLNEICSLEWSDVKTAEGVTYFDIPEGKTESSIRVVPVHNALAPFLSLCPQSGYLFPDLVPGGPDKKRGWNIGRDFGRLTLAAVEAEQLKAEERSTFHGFRKNVAQTFERHRIPETEAAQIIGHKKRGMTYGVYSPNGLRIEQKQGLVDLLGLPGVE